MDEAASDRPQQGRLVAGLDAPTASEILHAEIKDRYVIGEKIGVRPIFWFSEDEVIAGRNNKHMDFRLSVLKVPDGDRTSVVVSTVCTVHNLSGKLDPFFRRSVPQVRCAEANGERARGAEIVMRLVTESILPVDNQVSSQGSDVR